MTYHQCFRSTLALTLKNYTIRKRQIVSSLMDILIPLGFVFLMLFLKSLFTTQTFPGREYSAPPDHTTIPPFLSIPSGLRLAGSGGILVITSLPGSPGGAAAAQRFFASATALYPSVNLGTLGSGSLVAAELRALGKDTLSTLTLPGFADVAVLMADESALQSYCTAKDYGTAAKPPVYASIVFSSDTPNLDYSLRFNNSALPDPYPFVFTYSPKYMGSSKYVTFSAPQSKQYGATSATSSLNNATSSEVVKVPGFLTLQLAVDRFAINRPLEGSSPSLPALTTSLVTKFCEGIVALGAPGLGEDLGAACLALTPGETATLATALAAGPMAAELLAPQSIDLAPFPTRQYTQNIFYDGVLGALTLLFILAFMYPIGRLIAFLVNEKETKLRESLLAMGLSEVALVSSWFLTQTVIYTVLCLGITLVGLRLFPSSSPIIVFLLFWSFTLSTISLAMVIAVPFKSSNTASILGNTLYLLLYFTFYNIKDTSPVTLRTAIALLSPAAFAQGLQTMAGLETGGIGATLTTASTVSINNWTVGASIAMQLWDTVLYLLLAYYLDRTLPSALRDFGTPLPPWFPCLPSFWGCGCPGGRRGGGRGGLGADAQEKLLGPSSSSSSSSSSSPPTSLGPHFQGPSAEDLAKEEAGRCLSLVGLRKEFSTPDGVKVATDVDQLTLYEGQISCLLGHNGAGKTTLISMLTGLTPPTRGSATVFGKDLGGDLGAIRKDLGVCPQHDVLWPDLTVFEHLQLFGVIKGVKEDKIEEEGVKALAQVGLTEKRNALVSSLSGGMKRKLSVCLAFLGGSKVVLLDEPTSGMDPYSRRSTWQILQNAREGRVILLTTHFMDEADILGDRIAIMDAGRVACSGTPAFLKDSFNLGYTLTVVCNKGEAGGASSAALAAITHTHVPGAKRVSSAGNEAKFRLPSTSAPAFPALLSALESHPSVASLGMHVTSVEDIFMRIASHTLEQEEGGGAM